MNFIERDYKKDSPKNISNNPSIKKQDSEKLNYNLKKENS